MCPTRVSRRFKHMLRGLLAVSDRLTRASRTFLRASMPLPRAFRTVARALGRLTRAFRSLARAFMPHIRFEPREQNANAGKRASKSGPLSRTLSPGPNPVCRAVGNNKDGFRILHLFATSSGLFVVYFRFEVLENAQPTV